MDCFLVSADTLYWGIIGIGIRREKSLIDPLHHIWKPLHSSCFSTIYYIYKLGHLGAWWVGFTDIVNADPSVFSLKSQITTISLSFTYLQILRSEQTTNAFYHSVKKRGINIFIMGTRSCSQWRKLPLWVIAELCFHTQFEILHLQSFFNSKELLQLRNPVYADRITLYLFVIARSCLHLPPWLDLILFIHNFVCLCPCLTFGVKVNWPELFLVPPTEMKP